MESNNKNELSDTATGTRAGDRHHSWRPLLEGELARSAEQALDDILAALQWQPPASAMSLDGDLALLYHYVECARPDCGYDALAEEQLERCVAGLSVGRVGPALYGGYTGAAWLVHHLGGQDDEACEQLDELLLRFLLGADAALSFDLISGCAGYALYLLNRAQRPTARRCLVEVVGQLERSAVARRGGVAWRCPPSELGPEQRFRCPDGYFDLGVAHGAPAVGLALAGIAGAGVEVGRASRLAAAALRWLWSGLLPSEARSRFAYSECDGDEPRPARLAWCYGDAGAAVALWSAARALGDEAGAGRALDVALHAAARTLQSSEVVDGGLCHGAAGNALLFARLWHESGDERFAAASRRWFGVLLDGRQPELGIAGFSTHHAGSQVADPSFLTGVVGIALALLAGTTSVEPAWDQLLAASLPRPPR